MKKAEYLPAGSPIPDNPKAIVIRVHSNSDNDRLSEGGQTETGGPPIIDVAKISANELISRLEKNKNSRAIYVLGYHEAD